MGGDILDEKEFSIRLSKLREQKGVSARKMSIDLCLNTGYISNIETKHVLPSMPTFFQICDYLGISPRDFFDNETEHPQELIILINNLKKLNYEQLHNIASIVEDLAKIH